MRCIQVLDPFSETQCAAFARRYSARGELPKTSDMLPGHAALDFHDVEVGQLAMAMEKYTAYVLQLVPYDRLLLIDYFSSAHNQAPRSAQTARDEWTKHNEALIHAFVRDKGSKANSTLHVVAVWKQLGHHFMKLPERHLSCH